MPTRKFYDPTPEHLTKLAAPWCASYSGGKDSTSLVIWIEWLRRAGWVTVERPRLTMSDTAVEYADLMAVAGEMLAVLRGCGWECVVVRPEVQDRLYCRILGVGVPPVHPGIRTMRWCTNATKIKPQARGRSLLPGILVLTGRRRGESAQRDAKIAKGCAAGGECGIPEPDENTYDPILHWSTCQVLDWLNGLCGRGVSAVIEDLLEVTKRLVGVYGLRVDQPTFGFTDPNVVTSRFGCVGCPAIGAEGRAPAAVVRRHGRRSPLNELYAVWWDARLPRNRLRRPDGRLGAIRLEARKRLFGRVMDIQRRAGVVLVTPEDEAFIRQCWADKVYPRGWSEADEAVQSPDDFPLVEARPL